MTEKLFKVIETIKHDDRRIYELTKNDIGYYNFKGEKLLAHMICSELNILLEENKHLKEENKLLKYIIMKTLGVSDCQIEEELDRLRGVVE